MNLGLFDGRGDKAVDRFAKLRALSFDIDDGTGAAFATGAKARYRTAPCDLQIVWWRLMASPSTTTVLDVWVDRAASFPPTVADTIVAGEHPQLTAATFAESTRLAGWNAIIEAGSIFEVNVDSNNNAVRAVLELFYLPTL